MGPTLQDLVVSAHQRAAGVPADAAELTQRSRLLLDLLVDIKNNRHQKPDAGGSFWLKPRDVAPVQLLGISWEVLASPEKQVPGPHLVCGGAAGASVRDATQGDLRA